MSDYLYPYTDETPDERETVNPPLVVRQSVGNYEGRLIFVSRNEGEQHYDWRNDASVFLPDGKYDNCFAVLEGSDYDTRRFVIRSADEARGIIRALETALKGGPLAARH